MRVHRVDDALQVLERGVLDDDFALVTALLDLDPGFVEVGEAVGEAEEAGGDGLAAAGSALTGGVVDSKSVKAPEAKTIAAAGPTLGIASGDYGIWTSPSGPSSVDEPAAATAAGERRRKKAA